MKRLEPGDVILFDGKEHVVVESEVVPPVKALSGEYEGGVSVLLSKLKFDGKFSSRAIEFEAIQSGLRWSSSHRLPEDVKVIRRMKRVFV